jgi:hypothetical protein
MGQGAMLTATFKVAKVGKRTGLRRVEPTKTDATLPPSKPTGRVPRVTRLMALSIKLDELIRSGEVTSQRELAAVAHVTPARVTQILNLTHLAPAIQDELLLLPPVVRGKDLITERQLRAILIHVCWCEQLRLLRRLSQLHP